jgi:serine/threonine protein kinase
MLPTNPGRKAAATSQRRLELGPHLAKHRKSNPILRRDSQEKFFLPSLLCGVQKPTSTYLFKPESDSDQMSTGLASSPQFERPIIAKFARFHGEIGYYVVETRAYSWIDGHNIGPEFSGHITEDGRVIGFLIEYIQGRHATISDLPACKVIVRELHALGILRGDLNKHNFLIAQRAAVLVDFEAAKRSESSEAMEKEVQGRRSNC